MVLFSILVSNQTRFGKSSFSLLYFSVEMIGFLKKLQAVQTSSRSGSFCFLISVMIFAIVFWVRVSSEICSSSILLRIHP